MNRLYLIIFLLLTNLLAHSQQLKDFKLPSKEIDDALKQTPTPQILISPDGEYLLQLFVNNFPNRSEISRSEVKLAGTTIDTVNFINTQQKFDTSFLITQISNREELVVEGLPDELKISHLCWSPDSKYIAFTNITSYSVDLWLCQIDRKKARKMDQVKLNNCFLFKPFIWSGDSKSLIVAKPVDLTNETKKASGPLVFDNSATWGNISSSSFMINSLCDEQNFERMVASQLCRVNMDGKMENIGQPGAFFDFKPSTDGQFIVVQLIHKPYSYTAPYQAFPRKVEIWDAGGNLMRELFEIPSGESRAFGRGSVEKGPRNISWLPNEPASLYWLKASDGGDPQKKAAIRDKLYRFSMPFDGDPQEVIDFNWRCTDIYWGTANLAIAKEQWQPSSETRFYQFDPAIAGSSKTLIYSYKQNQSDSLPIDMIFTFNNLEDKIIPLAESNKQFFIWGKRISSFGAYFFINRYYVTTTNWNQEWQSIEPYHEKPVAILDADKTQFIMLRESASDIPDFFCRNLKSGVVEQLTTSLPVLPIKNKPFNRFVRFSRSDSVSINGILSLPPGYKVGDALLPVLVWVNPQIVEKVGASRIFVNTINQFRGLQPFDPSVFALKGWAVLNLEGMPLVQNENTVDFLSPEEQLNLASKAIIHFLDSLPYVDKSKICIGGIGPGATVATYLNCCTSSFLSGIGICGVYDQHAPSWSFDEQFNVFPPISIIDKVINRQDKSSILLIDGQWSQTLHQSEQMYMKQKDLGNIARMVILPNETSAVSYKESMLHVYWEIENWLNMNTKTRKK